MTRRLRTRQSDEVLEILELSISGLNIYLPEYRKTKDVDFLGELKIQAEAVWSCAEELRRRTEGDGSLTVPEPEPAVAKARQY